MENKKPYDSPKLIRYADDEIPANFRLLVQTYFEAADRLASLVEQHDEFVGAKKYAEQIHDKCRIARSPGASPSSRTSRSSLN